MVKFVVEYGKTGTAPPTPDGRLDAPTFHRNHEPIWSTIGDYAPQARTQSEDDGTFAFEGVRAGPTRKIGRAHV